MGRHLWLLSSGCAWAFMMYLLFDHEIRPFFEYQEAPTYRTLLRDRRTPEHQKRKVYFVDREIGEAESLSEPIPGGGYRMRSRMLLHMKSFGGIQLPDDRSYMSSEFRLDSEYLLADFHMSGNLQGIPITARGERQADKLLLSYNFVILKKDGLLVPFPRDATLSDNFLPYQGGGRLTEGKKWKMKFFDVGSVLSMDKGHQADVTDLYAVVVGQEKPPSRLDPALAWNVVVRRAPREDEPWLYLLWVDDEGNVLEQHMKINNLPCRIVLESRRTLTPEELQSFQWEVSPPK